MKEKLSEKLDALRGYPCIIVFAVIIVGVMLLSMLWPDREISTLENTRLKQRPKLSMSSLLQNQ